MKKTRYPKWKYYLTRILILSYTDTIYQERRDIQQAIRGHYEIELNRKWNNKVLCATDERNHSRKLSSFLDLDFRVPSSCLTPFLIFVKFNSKDAENPYTLPKEKISVAFEDGESTSKETIFESYFYSHCQLSKIKENHIKLE